MSIRSIGRYRAWHGLAMISLIALIGCEESEGGGFFKSASDQSDADVSQSVPKKSNAKARDVEAPDVFNVTDKGLWDGRPSLGGIWVAHPDVNQPERVIIRNTANSKSVVGALFRRERSNPGPVFQVSSDAGDALGMLAGAPAELSVVALRKEDPPEPKPEVETKPEAEPEVATAAVAATAAQTAKPQPEKSTQKSKKTKKAKKAKAAPVTDSNNAVDATPLAPIAGAAAAIKAAEVANAAKASSGSNAAPASQAAQPTQSTLDKPYIQVGLFGVKGNAESTAADLRTKGFQSSVRELKKQDKSLWRVVVGPASSKSERSALLKKAKGVGFNDAYPVRN